MDALTGFLGAYAAPSGSEPNWDPIPHLWSTTPTPKTHLQAHWYLDIPFTRDRSVSYPFRQMYPQPWSLKLWLSLVTYPSTHQPLEPQFCNFLKSSWAITTLSFLHFPPPWSCLIPQLLYIIMAFTILWILIPVLFLQIRPSWAPIFIDFRQTFGHHPRKTWYQAQSLPGLLTWTPLTTVEKPTERLGLILSTLSPRDTFNYRLLGHLSYTPLILPYYAS